MGIVSHGKTSFGRYYLRSVTCWEIPSLFILIGGLGWEFPVISTWLMTWQLTSSFDGFEVFSQALASSDWRLVMSSHDNVLHFFYQHKCHRSMIDIFSPFLLAWRKTVYVKALPLLRRELTFGKKYTSESRPSPGVKRTCKIWTEMLIRPWWPWKFTTHEGQSMALKIKWY